VPVPVGETPGGAVSPNGGPEEDEEALEPSRRTGKTRRRAKGRRAVSRKA